MASTGHLSPTKSPKTRTFIQLTLIILLSLIVTFSATKLLIFFLGFEGTLVPTLLLIARWGAQQERIEARYYFVFYTLISSLPLLLGLTYYYIIGNHLSISLLSLITPQQQSTTLATFCVVAFLVKVPIFGLHL